MFLQLEILFKRDFPHTVKGPYPIAEQMFIPKVVYNSVGTTYSACLNFDIGSSKNFWGAIRVSGNGEIFHQVKNKTPKLSSIKNDLKISNCQINHAENISAT